ncbi:hypothetical protein KIN20_025900 [Parelaphostrongylus tenuis]|uniref:Uncharacterized protein n=1 Tax=Parelaphostrongylus tenuis TaxID=148309 RepID=A0AAD5NB29_PARTN|nr:hypothetical protein KIN20_025900 [Parelaphostrongylus tenuis]
MRKIKLTEFNDGSVDCGSVGGSVVEYFKHAGDPIQLPENALEFLQWSNELRWTLKKLASRKLTVTADVFEQVRELQLEKINTTGPKTASGLTLQSVCDIITLSSIWAVWWMNQTFPH